MAATDIIFDTPAIRQELASTAPAVAEASQVAGLIFDASITQAQGELLRLYIQVMDEWLRTRKAASRADRLHVINLRHTLIVRREAEELTATPVVRHDLAQAAQRLARKAQSGWSGRPLPEDTVPDQGDDAR